MFATQVVKVGYYVNGQRVDLSTGATLPPTWTPLRVLTAGTSDLKVLADNTLVSSTISSVMATATAGLS